MYRIAAPLVLVCSLACNKAPNLYVYWDQNEEEQMLLPGGQIQEVRPAYDSNGQMCIFPDHSGRFTTGINPTLPGQLNPGSLLPFMNAPIGEAVFDKHGNFTGQILSPPGPYALPGSDAGGDVPPPDGDNFCMDGVTTVNCDPNAADSGCPPGVACAPVYNDNSTYTGCVFDSKGKFFAADIGQGQGQLASPGNGRLIEWFPPDYTTFCIIAGPTDGGVGPHHIGGIGGLQNPGAMAVDPEDNVYLPENGAGVIRKFPAGTLPQSAQECGPNEMIAAPYTPLPQITGIPGGVAWDPSCNCLAVTNIVSGTFGGPLLNWYDTDGHAYPGKGPVPHGPQSPFGLSVTPDGDVYFTDMSLVCDTSGCNPSDARGAIWKVTFDKNNKPSTPELVVGGLFFPIGTTVCDADHETCPGVP
jgi:hypothetical protein